MVAKQDCRSTTGRNIRHISNLFNGKSIDTITGKDLKDMKYHEVAEDDQWRIKLVKELTDVKYDQLELSFFDRTQIDEVLDYICTT